MRMTCLKSCRHGLREPSIPSSFCTSNRVWKLTIALSFFSSRRRHTRLQGDWSSDVCSSDLGMIGIQNHHLGRAARLAAGFDHARERVERAEEHTSEIQSPCNLVCRLLL